MRRLPHFNALAALQQVALDGSAEPETLPPLKPDELKA
jgi:hypothetical protein